MKIIPLASDSMGTRSSATFIETGSCNILIDPSSALGPLRYSLIPHAKEFERLNEHWQVIRKYAKKADILVVTHYHYDHHNPEEPGLYKGKTVFLKHPKENINKSQTARAAYFLKQLGTMPEEIAYSDGTERKFGSTKIMFSPAVFHGTNNKLGYVTEVFVDDGNDSFLYTSDVEGPAIDSQAEFILHKKPNIIYIDGPMTYLLGYRYSHQSLDASLKNIQNIISKIKPEAVILEHHLLRDIKWKDRIAPLVDFAEKKGTLLVTAAEFAGKKIDQLEANRKELWKKFPKMKAKKVVNAKEE